MKSVGLFSAFVFWALICLVSVVPAQEKPEPASSASDKTSAIEVEKSQVDDSENRKKERYRIGYQDTLDVQVYRHPELSGAVSVNPDGTIYLPRLDAPIVAVCKTERELANTIAAAYQKDYLKNPFVNVRAIDQKSQAVGVIGAVEKPGYYYLNRKVHLLELLTMAGGPDYEKAGTQLLVARTGSSSFCQENSLARQAENDENPDIELLSYKIKDVMKAQSYLWMKPGDIVSVLEADPFYVMGNVIQPGMFYLKETTTLTQAIARAEGFKPATNKENIRILRLKPDSSEREELIYKLKDIESNKIADPVILPNDIVAVSEDKAKSIINKIARSFAGGLGNIPFIIPR